MLASLPHRDQYRAALGIPADHTLIAISSTWSAGSLLGTHPTLIRRLLAELPIDEYRVAAIVHPNAVAGHGAYQLRSWLADCVRAGLQIVPPLEGWRATLIAADAVIGDHGAVTGYAAALGRPTLLAAFPDDDIAPGTAISALGRTAPRLDTTSPLRPQLEAALKNHCHDTFAEVAALTNAVPGESPERLRATFYRLLRLDEPAHEPTLHPLPLDGLTPLPAPRIPAVLVTARTGQDHQWVRLQRFPAEQWPHFAPAAPGTRAHLLVHHRHPARRLRAAADIVFALVSEAPATDAARASLLRQILKAHPGALLAAVAGQDDCLISDRDGTLVALRADIAGVADAGGANGERGGPPASAEDAGPVDPLTYASAALARHAAETSDSPPGSAEPAGSPLRSAGNADGPLRSAGNASSPLAAAANGITLHIGARRVRLAARPVAREADRPG
ncbi:hypothetical protein [Catenuloplanes japonicus]|uniref:hypothetical protein n=1 Tax=Catenuloplanes japonicus TaxID=33876 RepID=UPI000690939C|nr:hypothetical protein [Catenuloplanes japonicus]